MSVLDTFVNKNTLSLGAVAVFLLAVFGVEVVSHDQIALGLAFLAASRVTE